MLYDGLLGRGQATYQQCCNDFGYSATNAPRRVLTKLSKGRGVGFMDVRRSCIVLCRCIIMNMSVLAQMPVKI